MGGRLGQAGPWLLTMKVLGRAQARVDSSIAVIVDSTLRRLLQDSTATRRLQFFLQQEGDISWTSPSCGLHLHVANV